MLLNSFIISSIEYPPRIFFEFFLIYISASFLSFWSIFICFPVKNSNKFPLFWENKKEHFCPNSHMFSSYRDNCTKKAPSDYLSHPLVLSIIPYFLINIFSSLTGNNKTIPIDRILSYFLLRIIQQSNYDFLLYNMDCLYSTQPTKSAILSFKPPHLYVCLYRLGMA